MFWEFNPGYAVKPVCALTLAKYYDVKYPIASQIPSQKVERQAYKKTSYKTPFGVIEKNTPILGADAPKPNIPRWMRK